MDNPLASSIGPGTFRLFSEKNKIADLSRIINRKSENIINSRNTSKFPTTIKVINLDIRTDRWLRFQELNKDLFKIFNIGRFSATEDSDTRSAIFQSYMNCLNEAFLTNDVIIIMEDDAYLADGALDKIKQAFDALPAEWDVLIGNHYFFGQIEVLNEHIARPSNIGSSLNFAIYNKTILDKINSNIHLRKDDKLDFDHFMTSKATSILNYSIWPMVSREYLSHSDHKNAIKDMTIRIREHANLFQFIDSDIYYPSLESW